ADRRGATGRQRDLEFRLHMSAPHGWEPPILRTVASTGEGTAELWAAVADHRTYLERERLLAERRARRLADEVRTIVVHSLERRVEQALGAGYERLLADVTARRLDPYSAAAEIVAAIEQGDG